MKFTIPLLLTLTLLFTACGNETRYTYYQDGVLKTEAEYNDKNKLDGTYKIYYRSGELQKVLEYEDNKKHGKRISYHKNGKISLSGAWENGMRAGTWKSYNSKGKHWKSLTYDGKGNYFKERL